MKRGLSLVFMALVVGGGVWGYLFVQRRGTSPPYRFARVERGPLTAAVSATGNLNAVITVQVGSQVSGQIKQLFADFNSVVRKGQVIARIDPEIFEARVGQARAELESAQAAVLNQQAQVERARADLENARAAHAEGRAQTAKARVAVVDAKRDLGRKTELFRRELIAKSDQDTAQAVHDSAVAQADSALAKEQSLAAAIGSAQAQLRVAEAMLQSARAQVKQKHAALQQVLVDLDHTTIRAPVDGVVVSRAVDVGQTVAASLQAPTLFTIAQDLTKMQVETSVDEADIGRVKLGDRATFTVDAFPNEPFTGEVMQIRKTAQVVQNVVTYVVVIAVANPDGTLLPGMTANVRLIVAAKGNVLKVPNAALRFRPVGSEAGIAGPLPVAGAWGADRAGRASTDSIRDRLVRSLNLNDEQQRKLEPIFEERHQQRKALRGATLSEEERQVRAQKVKQATRARIREMLTPDQRAHYDAIAGAGAADGRSGIAGRVWVLGPDGKPKPIGLTLGLSDGMATEVRGGDVRKGQEVILGLAPGVHPPSRPAGGAGGEPRLKL